MDTEMLFTFENTQPKTMDKLRGIMEKTEKPFLITLIMKLIKNQSLVYKNMVLNSITA